MTARRPLTRIGGRVTQLPASDSLPWACLSGAPTTLAGYGITDGVSKSGDTMTGPLIAPGLTTNGAAWFNPSTGTKFRIVNDGTGNARFEVVTQDNSAFAPLNFYASSARFIGASLTVDSELYAASPVWTSGGFQYHQHQSPHVAYVKKTGGYNFYWRRNDTGLVGGANEVELMVLDEAGTLVNAGDIKSTGWVYSYGGVLQAGNPSGQYCRIRYDGTITSDGTNYYKIWHAGNSARIIVSSSTPPYEEGAIWVQP